MNLQTRFQILDRVEIAVMDEADQFGPRTIQSYIQEATIYARRGEKGMARLAICSAISQANRTRAPKQVRAMLFRLANKAR